MAVKLELYRVFHEVARMGNISAAAQNLFISQSAVSQSIKQLEEQLQVRLFSRSTKGVYLTSEGKLLQEYISHALGLIQSGEEKLAQSRQLLTGELISPEAWLFHPSLVWLLHSIPLPEVPSQLSLPDILMPPGKKNSHIPLKM